MREGNNKMQDKIYRRNTQSGGTPKKKKDEKARFETVMHSDGSMGGALTCEN